MNSKEDSKEQIEATEEMDVIEISENTGEKVLVSEEACIESEEDIQENKVNEVKKDRIGSKLLASFLDQVVCSGASIIILFIVNLIIRMFGYKFVLLGTYNVFILIYVIVNILYIPIMSSTKLKNTFGKKFLKI